jgi:hypothetical protein
MEESALPLSLIVLGKTCWLLFIFFFIIEYLIKPFSIKIHKWQINNEKVINIVLFGIFIVFIIDHLIFYVKWWLV